MNDTEMIEGQWRALQPDAQGLHRAATALNKASKMLASADGYESLPKVRAALAKVEQASALPEALGQRATEALASTQAWLRGEWERRGREVALEAADHFVARGIEARLDGATLVASPFTLVLDAGKDQATIEYGGETVKAKVPLVPAKLFAAWQAASAALGKGETPPERFAELLIEAAEAVIGRGKDGRAGARVPLPDVHFELFIRRQTAQARTNPAQGKIKEYPRAQFAWDLARLLAAPHFLQRGRRTIELLPASASAARSRVAAVPVVSESGALFALGDLRIV